MASPRASDGDVRNPLQGADLLNIAGEKTVDSGTLGYPKQMTAEGSSPPPYFFRMERDEWKPGAYQRTGRV